MISFYFVIIRFQRHNLKNLGIKVIDNNKHINSDEISFKGEKILKSKLINDYLSKISNDSFFDKEEERSRFNLFFNLPTYSND